MVNPTKLIVRTFKMSGLGVRSDAVKALASSLNGVENIQESLDIIISALKEKIERRELTSSMIGRDAVAAVVADLSKEDEEARTEAVQYLGAFETPRLTYDPTRRSLTLITGEPMDLFADAEWKPKMFRERYWLARQRLARHALFAEGGGRAAGAGAGDHCQLTYVDSLLGSEGVRWLCGLLVQVEEGRYYLEDAAARVPLDLSEAGYTTGLYTENCFVIVEGEMVNNVFKVKMMGMPPAEARGDALRAIAGGPHVDLFGKGGAGGQDQLARLEAEAQGQMVAILADVHLDLPEVLEKLKVLFAGFASCEPLPVFVLMGNFSSKSASMGVEGIEDMIESFTALSDLLASFPALCAEGRFVFVPGPGDPGHGNVLPRMPLPRPLRQALGRRLPHAVFATNPCRLRVYTQELVLFREDLLRKMQRHALVQQDKEAPDSDATETLVATLLAQGHLCPLPLPARPIHWKADPALQLYPLPHAVVLADQTDQYKWTYEDCHAFNPGSFPTDFSFIVYTPATQDVEFSKIDD